MSTAILADVSGFLTEISERDQKWDLRKNEACKLAECYKNTQLNRLYERMSHCADRLKFNLLLGEPEIKLKLEDAFFCRVRHCPICQWRRCRMWFGKFVNTLPKMLEDYPSARFLHLTLTVRNCEVGNLRSTLVEMNRAWTRLSQRKEFKGVLGWVKAVEFTRNTDADSPWFDSVHPHFHALLMVRPSYFGKGYVPHENWVKTWRECLRVDYDPSVRIQVIKPKTKLPGGAPLPSGMPRLPGGVPLPAPLPYEMVSALSEVVKYAVKPQDLVIGGEWLLTLTEQLRGTKAIALGGIMRQYIREPDEDDENLVAAGLEVDDLDSDDSVAVLFGWRERLRRYRQLQA